MDRPAGRVGGAAVLGAGWHWLPGNDDPQPPLPVSTFLDLDSAMGMRSSERLCRIYFKGRPPAQEIAEQALAWHRQGCRVQVGNEPNLPQEGFGGGPGAYGHYFMQVRVAAPGARLYYAGMSPGVPGWRDWYVDDYVQHADGIAAHAYGTVDQMRAVVESLVPLGKPLWLAEVNFGAGQRVDIEEWTRDHLHPFLDWCAGVPQVEAVSYFAYAWRDPDVGLDTPIDGAGTAVERLLRAWTPPTDPGGDPMPDVVLSVPSRQAPAHPGNYATTPIGTTVGVVLHSTGGKARSLALEYQATLAWFANPQAGVSAHRVVGPAEVATCVPDSQTAWHAKAQNSRRRGIELAHPVAWNQVQYPAFQYEAAGELVARWSLLDNFPVRMVTDETQPGIIHHRDTVQGRADGKTDPTPPFDDARLLDAAERWVARLAAPPAGFDIVASRDRLWAEAEALEQAGYPWFGQGVKALVAVQKGER